MPSIDSALFNLLGSSSTLDNYTPSRLLTERIEFVAPTKKDSYMEQLRLKYKPINGIDKSSVIPQTKSVQNELYNKDRVDLRWRQKRSVGCGLVNPANTCYLNSTLQCLLYTPPLINYLLTDHKKHCRSGGFCVSCSLLQLYNTVNNSSGGACRPSSFIHHLKMIAKHFCFGRQEDAHEFLIHLRDKMIQHFLNSHPKVDNTRKDTTPTHAVFGGKLVSTVTCTQCNHQSNTNECFLELGLDVRHSESIQQSFNKLCKRETLSGANSYKCEKCKRTVIATKQFKIAETPNVLVLHLKRFQFGGFTGKLKNQITFPEHLDLANWTKQKGATTKYNLYAVLVHAGSSAQCGHYYCFVKSASGSWHCMNDTSVNTVSLQRVLNSEAYLLFYIRHEGSISNGVTAATNGHAVSSHSNGQTCGGPSKANGNHNSSKVRLMESNPFFSESPKQTKSGLNSGRPVKFNLSVNSNKVKNPYLNKTQKSNGAGFIGPLLPNGSMRSNGTASKHIPTHETAPVQPNAEKQSPASNKTGQSVNSNTTEKPNENSDKTATPKKPSSVVSCAASLSSLDILKNTYKDESEEESQVHKEAQVHKPNAQPALILKKKKSGEKNSVFDRLKDAAEKKTPSSGNVFERLGMKSGIKSWSGEESKNFKKGTENWKSIENPHKRVRDDYEEELDEGRVKKVKQQKNNNFREKHDFQKAHDFNKNQKRWEERKSWKQNGQGPKYFWKNKKHKV